MMTDTANLEDGFYWVKFDGEWQPAEYCKNLGAWFVCGCEQFLSDRSIDEIDPRPIKREE